MQKEWKNKVHMENSAGQFGAEVYRMFNFVLMILGKNKEEQICY